jgi:hypothetical protein
VSDIGSSNYSETAASNNATPPAGWPEGMNPSDVNNSARENMAGLKRFWNRNNSTHTTDAGGTNTAYTLTYDVAEASYYAGEEFSFVVDKTCGAAPTLNINGLGADSLRKFVGGSWVTLNAGDIVALQVLRVRYNSGSTTFDIINATSPSAATTWTPTDTTGQLTLGSISATYQQIGNWVFATSYFSCTGGGGMSNLFGGLPVPAASANYGYGGGTLTVVGGSISTGPLLIQVVPNSSTFKIMANSDNPIATNTFTGLTLAGTIIYPIS